MSKLIFWYIGAVHHEIDKGALVESGDIIRAAVIVRKTAFMPAADPQEEYPAMVSELCNDPERNALIVEDVVREAKNGGTCLVLSDRKSHCNVLGAMLRRGGIMPDILTGDTANDARKAIVERLNAGAVKAAQARQRVYGQDNRPAV